MEEQNSQFPPSNSELLHGKITEAIIGCAFEVINELGIGFLESVYGKALAIALQEKGWEFSGSILSMSILEVG